MFSGESASCICRVTSRSCWEGKATPLGWLWARIMLLAPAYRAFSTTWRTLTGEAATLPLLMQRQVNSLPLASRQTW